MDKTEPKQIHELEDIDHYCNLWNLGDDRKATAMLRNIVDSIHHDYYAVPGKQLPSFLITGAGQTLTGKALLNSLQLFVQECPASYLENGVNSSYFFDNSTPESGYLITDIEQVGKLGESVIWRYIQDGRCAYYNTITRRCDRVIHCNGLIVLTTRNLNAVSRYIVNAVDHVIELEPYTSTQLKILVQSILEFCGVSYRGNAVLDELVKMAPLNMDKVMKVLKTCIVLMKSELSDKLTLKLVHKAKQYHAVAVMPKRDEIPF